MRCVRRRDEQAKLDWEEARFAARSQGAANALSGERINM